MVPGNPQMRTIVRKPVIYDAVMKIERYLKKSVKKGTISMETATDDFNKVLDVANSVCTADTKSFEKEISSTNDVVSLVTRNALAKQYHRLFELEGVKLNFRPDALTAIAQEASRRNSGARGLRAILEEVMLDVMYEIPSLTGVKECVVTREVVENRARPELVLESKAAS